MSLDGNEDAIVGALKQSLVMYSLTSHFGLAQDTQLSVN